MISLAKFSIRRPKTALIGWLIAAGVLIWIGFGVANTMSPSITVVKGTESARAQQLADQQFGPSQLVPILLEGQKAQLNQIGPKLVIALTKRPHTRVLSAWDAGSASATLRPNPNAAMLVVSVDRPEKDVVKTDQPQIEKLVAKQIGGAPVKAFITGQPSIDRGIKDASVNDLLRTEAIAVGVVFLLLLLGLRAPVAAVIVTAVGAASMLAAFGETALLGHIMKLDAVGLAAGSMTGLAVGVGFALLVMDRFHREELPEGSPHRDGATAALRDLETTGKAVLVGGTGLVVALLLVAVIGPYDLMVSVGTAATTAAMFAVGGAVVVMPASLALLGHRINALSFPAPRFLARAWSAIVGGGNWITRHAVYFGFAATAVLGAIAIPALSLDTGQPGVATMLPKDSKARIAFEEVSRVMGPGWATPYNVIVVANNGAVTTPAMLASINKFQKQIAANATVDSVAGPGAINDTSLQLKKFGPSLVNSAKISKQSKKDLLKLINGLGQAGAGSKELRAGLESAVSGAQQLNSGAGSAHAGSAALRSGLIQASSGSQQLSAGLNTALSGANQLKAGGIQLSAGASQLVAGVGQLQAAAKPSGPALASLAGTTATVSQQIAGAADKASGLSGEINSAIAALQSMDATAKTQPGYSSALAALQNASGAAGGVSTAIGAANSTAGSAKSMAAAISSQAPALLNGINQVNGGVGALATGIAQLRDGNAQLASGIAQLANGGGQLNGGLGQLTNGAGQLEAGLALLSAGTGQLASGLAPAPSGAGQIASGLGIMQAAVVKARGQIPSTKDLETLMKQSPGMFSSGYFVLAAVEGARGADRNQATFAVNLLRGGTAGQIVVISKYPSTDPRSTALQKQLVTMSAAFAKKNNAQVAVGGPGASLGDWTSSTKSKIWINVAVLAVVLGLILMLAARAIVLPAAAIVFSLLVAASTFGIVQLLFGGSNPPLGGPGYVDPVTIISIFTVAFPISVVFATLLLLRTREALMAGETNRDAVRTGLRYTAAAATGAGIVMVAAIVPFATADVINLRELGVGMAVGILLDVVLFRPVLLPAAAVVLGRFGWWPTHGQPSGGPPSETRERRRAGRRVGVPRLHLPHRRPGPAHH
jgi:RND superfamily putative drug exporter